MSNLRIYDIALKSLFEASKDASRGDFARPSILATAPDDSSWVWSRLAVGAENGDVVTIL